MLTNLPTWLRDPLLNWLDIKRTLNYLPSAPAEHAEWEAAFNQAFRGDKRTMKGIGRDGIPSELRGKIWCKILHVQEIPEHFKDFEGAMLSHFGTTSAEYFPEISADILSLDRLHLPEDQLETLKAIIYLLYRMHPSIGFKPTTMIISLSAIFLTVMGPGDVLGCMASIIRAHSHAAANRNEWAYFPCNRKETLLFERVFRLLLKEYEPALYGHIKRILKAEVVSEFDWQPLIGRMLVELYPKKVIKRIMDVYLIEGFKVLYRIALAHLYLHRDFILQAASVEGLKKAIYNAEHGHSKEIVGPLFERAFLYNLSRQKIAKYREKAKGSAFADIDFRGEDEKMKVVLQRPFPKLTEPSEFMTQAEWAALWRWIPARFKCLDLDMVYSTERDGFSLTTLYKNSEAAEQLILLVEMDDDVIVGAFISQSLEHRRTFFFGTGETFIFTLCPEAKPYLWSPKNDSTSFIIAKEGFLAFGAGSSGFGLHLDQGLAVAESCATKTFDNPPLFHPERTCRISNVEVYSFV